MIQICLVVRNGVQERRCASGGAMRINRVVAWVMLAAVVSCSPALTLAPATEGGGGDYDDEFRGWTRTARLYEDFETRMVLHATYFSPRFINAYLGEYRRVYEPTPAEYESLATRLRRRAAANDCFFMAAFAGDRDWNDFSLSNSMWRVYLVTSDGRKVKSTSVSEVKTDDAVYRHFFSYFELFYEGYMVCFSCPGKDKGEGYSTSPILHEGLDWFEMQFRSPVGVVDLKWEMDD